MYHLIYLYLPLFILGPFDLGSNFEFNENLMKTIRAYLCYVCFSWFNPIYTSVIKKINEPVKENDIDEGKNENNTYEEIIELTHQFQKLLNNYIHDMIDIDTLNYFKARKEIERIDQLLTTGYSPDNNQGNFSNSCIIIFYNKIVIYMITFSAI